MFETLDIDAILTGCREQKRAELQRELDCVRAGEMDEFLDPDQRSSAIDQVMRTIADYDAYVRKRRRVEAMPEVWGPTAMAAAS